jgi:hypothetical protein
VALTGPPWKGFMDSGAKQEDKGGMLTSHPAAARKSLTMKLESRPEWGAGLVVRDLPLHWEMYFEHGGERKFVKSLALTLVPVTISPTALAALEVKAFARHSKSELRTKSVVRARTSPAAKARFASLTDQIAFFEKIFPGGFSGDVFTTEERGVLGAKGKLGFKEAAIALAQAELSHERFKQADAETLFDNAKKVLQATTIVFPMEGHIPFASMDTDGRTSAVEALKELLHGADEYGDRLQTFAGALSMKDKKDAPKAPSWPFATIFSAYMRPAECVCVKPTAFASQAATFGMTVERSQPVTASGYREFHEIATKTRDALKEAGHEPRDLMDVYSFIWRTHAEKA